MESDSDPWRNEGCFEQVNNIANVSVPDKYREDHERLSLDPRHIGYIIRLADEGNYKEAAYRILSLHTMHPSHGGRRDVLHDGGPYCRCCCGTAEKLEVTVLAQRGEAVEPTWQVWTRFPMRVSCERPCSI
jgi:hypothetical protein